MSITLKEIAKQAGVSPSSVSLVLNKKPNRISKQTSDLIRKIAQENKYRPNVVAQSLVTRQTKTLGLIIPDIENLFFSKLAKTLEMEVRKKGYALVIVNSNDSYEEDGLLIDLLISRGIDGLFLVISNEAYLHQEELEGKLTHLPVPFVMIDRVMDFTCNKVYFDNVTGSYLATNYLLEQGHRRISCICNTYISNNALSRINGYRMAMEEYGIKVPKEYIIPANYRMEGGYQAGEQIMKTDCTAIFVSNDMMALGLLKKFMECGVRVPEDYMIVSYDNLLSDFLFGIKISSVDQDIKELGMRSWKVLQSCLQAKEDMDSQEICLLPKLIIR
ncbi:LacI family DNA-binding transcriptional regulator [Clostridium sp. E02]|uniref:LacI family DNA-binding transcriptional regulator n=1 Tax=Clostridium sp. E02 TaxID=2487134 RepID=UPI000F520518|nr:LacI family DNA-binding transcriptional regulator [Clostridium sp. E02]